MEHGQSHLLYLIANLSGNISVVVQTAAHRPAGLKPRRQPKRDGTLDIVVGVMREFQGLLENCQSREPAFLPLQKSCFRIIYNTERIQELTLYCCSPRISGWAGQGCLFAKWLQQNETQKFSIAALAELLNKLTPQKAVRSV